MRCEWTETNGTVRCRKCSRCVRPDVFAVETLPECPGDGDRSTAQRGMSDVAVVILSHNYGRFLADAIESSLSQTALPAEIVIVDDASSDDTASVAKRFAERGVRYERINARNVYLARKRGMESTTAPFLIFLDADDQLGATYIERGRALFADSQIGLAWTDLQHFGDDEGRRSYRPGDIERANYIHAGAMVRRVALEQSQAFESDGPIANLCADWFAWREVRRGGWQDRKFDAEYRYRQHGAGMHLTGRNAPYFEYAHLRHENVPIILPLSGREQWWDQLTGWIASQTWPRIELIVIDSSGRDDFQQRCKQWLAAQHCATTYVPLSGPVGLADADRRRRENFLSVQRIMPTIYRHLERTAREYNLVVEDDVLPPVDAIERLLWAMTPKAACVSGVVRSRYHDGIIAWSDARIVPIRTPRSGVETIHGSGFGCLLFRRSVFSKLVLHHAGSGNFDQEAGKDVVRIGRDWLIDWGLTCVHAGLPV